MFRFAPGPMEMIFVSGIALLFVCYLAGRGSQN